MRARRAGCLRESARGGLEFPPYGRDHLRALRRFLHRHGYG